MGLVPDFQALFEHSLDGILVTTPGGDVLLANPAACAILRRSAEEIVRVGRGGIADSTDPRLHVGLEQRARSGHFAGELTFIRGDGARFPAEVSSAVYHDADGRELTCLIFRDVSERHQRVAEVQAAVENLRLVIDTIPLAIEGIAPDGRVVLWNAAAERLFGWRADEVIGQENPLIPAGRAAEHAALRARVIAGEVLTGIELQRCRREGGLLDVTLSTAAVRDASGRITVILALFDDIAARKAAERVRLRESEIDALRQLSLGLRHEMNNALASMRAEVELLAQSGRLSREDQASIEAVWNDSDRIVAALRRIVDVQTLQSVPYMGSTRMLDVSGGT